MNNPMIDVQSVSMRFNLAKERTDTLKEYTLKLLKGQLKYDEFWAVKDVSFTLNKGESLALIGRNGSGKSTMLKIIAGVLAPTKGKVIVRGNIAPLIELGILMRLWIFPNCTTFWMYLSKTSPLVWWPAWDFRWRPLYQARY